MTLPVCHTLNGILPILVALVFTLSSSLFTEPQGDNLSLVSRRDLRAANFQERIFSLISRTGK
jgi:hypothetical protein